MVFTLELALDDAVTNRGSEDITVQSFRKKQLYCPKVCAKDRRGVEAGEVSGAGGWSWSGMREKYCYLAGGWRLVLEEHEREIL